MVDEKTVRKVTTQESLRGAGNSSPGTATKNMISVIHIFIAVTPLRSAEKIFRGAQESSLVRL